MHIPLFYAVSAALFLSGASCLAQSLDATATGTASAADTAPVTAAAKDCLLYTSDAADE